MRYRLAVALSYFALMTLFIYGEWNAGRDDTWLLPFLVLAQLALGFALDRWWAPVLPLALVAIAVPAGFPEVTPGAHDPFPVWFGVATGVVFAVPLVVLGVIGRKLAKLRARVRSSSAAIR
jgi:hypothetical protein